MAAADTSLLVVAIDIGMTESGYAYSFVNNPGNVSFKMHSGGCRSLVSIKIPSTVLLKWDKDTNDFKTQSCGYEAKDTYADLLADNTDQDYVLVDNFKMNLYRKFAVVSIREESEVTLSNGKTLPAARLFAIFIDYMKQDLLREIQKRGLGILVAERDIKWVFTLPVIWMDGGENLMRKSADMAGIDTSRLSFAIEPAAAVLGYLYDLSYLSDTVSSEIKALVKSGTQILVIDAGDIVDFTLLEVSDGNKMDIIQERSGCQCGGTSVNNAFFQILKDAYGTDVFYHFEKSNPVDFVELKKEFEGKMRSFTMDRKTTVIKFPWSFSEVYDNMKEMLIQDARSAKYGGKVQVSRDKLKIDTILLKSAFHESCENIVFHTQKIQQKSSSISAILMVGGYHGLNVVRERMIDAFSNIRIIIPNQPELSVWRGAVLYGHAPPIVKSRIVKYKYDTDPFKDFY